MEKFRQVNSHKGFSVGDIIHIKRWYWEEGSSDFNKLGNKTMVDVKHIIDEITIDDKTGHDRFWCGIYSTSSTDIANKGIVTKFKESRMDFKDIVVTNIIPTIIKMIALEEQHIEYLKKQNSDIAKQFLESAESFLISLRLSLAEYVEYTHK